MTASSLRVVHLSSYDTVGGAARGARALHVAMLDQGIDSLLVVGQASGTTTATIAPHPKRFAVAGELDRRLWKAVKSPRTTWRSPAVFGAISAKEINALGADIINPHWITNGLMSVRQIGRLQAPLVWSMYDMWPFSGTEHYQALAARYQHSYEPSTRPSDESGFDLDRWTWQRKQHNWHSPMTMVPASRWLQDAVQSSSLMGSWPTRRIPHVINVDIHQPRSMSEARAYFNLPSDRKLIAFLATAGISDERKGWTYLREAVKGLRIEQPDVEVVIVGPKSATPPSLPVHWLGELNNDDELNLAYCAADVIATPSIQDNMPLAAMEAHASGRAVVGFDVGGLPDIVEHGTTGYLSAAADAIKLMHSLNQALNRSPELGAAARLRAERLWSPKAVVAAYLDLYEEIRASHREGGSPVADPDQSAS